MEEKNIYYVTDDIAYYEVGDKIYDLSNDREIADYGLFCNLDPAIREKSYADYVPQKKVEPVKKNEQTHKIVRRIGKNTMIVQEQTTSDFILTEVLSSIVKAIFYIIFFPIHILHYATFSNPSSKTKRKRGRY